MSILIFKWCLKEGNYNECLFQIRVKGLKHKVFVFRFHKT